MIINTPVYIPSDLVFSSFICIYSLHMCCISEFTCSSLIMARTFPSDTKYLLRCSISQARLGYAAVTNRPYISAAQHSGHLLLTRVRSDVGQLFSTQ